MTTSDPLLLVAELSYRCPLRCPYCSNPVALGRWPRRDELSAADWARIFREAADLGVLQLALTGGEPLLRHDLTEIAAAGSAAGLYSTLVTSGIPFRAPLLGELRAAGLDHVQISFQHSDPAAADAIAGRRAFETKRRAAEAIRALGFPLTVNVVVHRHNVDHVEDIITLAERVGAHRLELANVQYHGWAELNRDVLMPTTRQLHVAEAAVTAARKRLGPRMKILWVLSDYHEGLPKPCMGGWGRQALVVSPTGEAMPCQSANTISGLHFDNVRDRSLSEIWRESDAFRAFRGRAWMQEPCRACPLERQDIDFGGCRCQAFALTGNAAATDPACHLSPSHAAIAQARHAHAGGAFKYRAYRYARSLDNLSRG